MKTLRNVIISGGLLRSDGSPAEIGDTVRLYKDDGTTFTAEITALAEVNCGAAVNYTVEYESETVIRDCELLDQGDVLDCCAILDERLEALEGGSGTSLPIWNSTREITQYLTVTGTAGNEIIVISDTK